MKKPNKVVEKMRARRAAAEERARERIVRWFEEHDRPFAISQRSHHLGIWMLVATVLCAGVSFAAHTAAMQSLSSIHSVLGA